MQRPGTGSRYGMKGGGRMSSMNMGETKNSPERETHGMSMGGMSGMEMESAHGMGMKSMPGAGIKNMPGMKMGKASKPAAEDYPKRARMIGPNAQGQPGLRTSA